MPKSLGDPIRPGQYVPCPRCGKRHRVLKPHLETQRLLFVACAGVPLAVAIEGRYLPQAN